MTLSPRLASPPARDRLRAWRRRNGRDLSREGPAPRPRRRRQGSAAFLLSGSGRNCLGSSILLVGARHGCRELSPRILTMRSHLALLVALLMLSGVLQAQKPRERDLKLPIGGAAGPLDAITDVAGVEVGHTTLISGSGKLVVGRGPVRTGVTIVHPRGRTNNDPVFAAWFALNGNGEMTGTTWIQESGLLEGPVAITNTHSVGVVRDAIIQWA